MLKKSLWILFALLAILIGLYPTIYLFLDRRFGLLSSKPDALLADLAWNAGFYSHIFMGGLALLIGWTQFSPAIRAKRLRLHRQIGKIYVLAAMISALAGFYIAFFATGGSVAKLGFICLAIIWFSTTLAAYLHIKNGRVVQHEKMMIFSYAACFAAVTLRIWLPIWSGILQDFIPAYRIVAWLSWVPNMFVAYLLVRKK